MAQRPRIPALPREAIWLSSYDQLDLYIRKFAAAELGLVLLLGRQGTGKTECVKRALGINDPVAEVAEDGAAGDATVLYVEGHMQPFGLYHHLWEYRNRPVVLDDLDKLYADAGCVRLLKPLCNTQPTKRIAWVTNATFNLAGLPAAFHTASRVILIANEWRTVNANVRALEDRAIILHFDPPNDEVHRRVGEWFDDAEVYSLIASVIPAITTLSMRHYVKGSQLRRAGLPDWRASVLQMVLPDPRLACIVALEHELTKSPEKDRVDRFIAATGSCRATYFRLKAKLANTGNGAARAGRPNIKPFQAGST